MHSIFNGLGISAKDYKIIIILDNFLIGSERFIPTTLAPKFAKLFDMALPIPFEPPVTTTT